MQMDQVIFISSMSQLNPHFTKNYQNGPFRGKAFKKQHKEKDRGS
jgi:hypothetical protein